MGGVFADPSVLPHQQQEGYIAELCLELAQCMARADLWSRPGPIRPTSQSRRHFHGHSSSWVWSPSSRPQGWRWPNVQEKTLWQGSWDQEGDVARAWTSHNDIKVPHPNIQVLRPSPTDPAGTCLPHLALHNLIPLMSCFLDDLHLHPQLQESWSRTWRGGTPTHTEGFLLLHGNQWMSIHPKTWWRTRSDSTWMMIWMMTFTGHGPSNLLKGGPAKEWDNTPSPSVPLTVDPP